MHRGFCCADDVLPYMRVNRTQWPNASAWLTDMSTGDVARVSSKLRLRRRYDPCRPRNPSHHMQTMGALRQHAQYAAARQDDSSRETRHARYSDALGEAHRPGHPCLSIVLQEKYDYRLGCFCVTAGVGALSLRRAARPYFPIWICMNGNWKKSFSAKRVT